MKLKLILVIFYYLLTNNSYAVCSQPSYCNRTCWDPLGTHPAQTSPTSTIPSHIIVHHTGDGIVFPTTTNYIQKMQFYWDLHVLTNGWSDIGYNWLIDRNGIIYEGRGSNKVGAHFSCMNTATMGVALIGDFTLETPSTASITSLRNLVAWETSAKSISVTGTSYHTHSQLTLSNVSGHRDGNTSTSPSSCASGTVCPGPSLYSLLPSLRTTVAGLPCYSSTSSSPPSNDNCNNAITLTSNTTCISTSGTVNNATADVGFAKPSCDLFATPTGAGVFYKFTATQTSHSIIVNPTGNLDAVVTLYSGASCFSLSEIECEDTPGGGGVTTTINATSLTIGNTYWIRVYDYGSIPPSNGNFTICVTHTITSIPQDITLTGNSITPSTVTAGGIISSQVTQNYSGGSSSLPNVYVNYYLSSDCVFDATDVYLGNDFSTINATNTSELESRNLTIPSGTTAGNYYILFVADATNVVAESNENNNTVCSQITVASPVIPQDITLTGNSISPSSLAAGGNLMAQVTQNYSGGSSSLPNVYVNYYLSSDCIFDASDVYLGNDFSTINATNTSELESRSLTIPSGTTAGTYYILFVADATNVVTESNENNNTLCSQVTITSAVTPQDIYLTNQTITSSISVNPGSTVSVQVDQNYSGGSSTVPNIDLHYYLSTNCNFDASDIYLDDDYSSINASNTSETETQNLTIPNTTSPGSYFIVFVADATNAVVETNENNNETCLQILVTNPLSINESSENDGFSVYPNPTSNYLNVDLKNTSQITSVSLYDVNGKVIYTKTKFNSSILHFETDSLSSGVYFIQIESVDKKKITKKFVKQ